MGSSQQIRTESPVKLVVPFPVLRGPKASRSVVAVHQVLIQELWQHQPPSTSYCHPYSRRFVFPCSLRDRRLSAVGYDPCPAEKIIGIAPVAYGRLCLGDETTHPPQASAVTRLIVPY